MKESDALEMAVVERIADRASLSLEDLQRLCSEYTWNRFFAAVDRLSRREAISLQRVDRNTYLVSLGPHYQTGQATSSARQASSAVSSSRS
jgi:hypothetical protein